MKITLKDGKFLVKLARRAIELYLNEGKVLKPQKYDKKFSEKSGVFVTLQTFPEKELRGCIGIPSPVQPLISALTDSAINAATHDPRFPPINIKELENIVIEITVLTQPELIKVKNANEYPSKIKIGRDGLIVEQGFYSGLLLPQVPVEWKWNELEFLSHTCNKAGLAEDCWLSPETKIYKFQGKIFSEREPNGKVIEH